MLKMAFIIPFAMLILAIFYFGFVGVPIKNIMLEKNIPSQEFPA